MTNNNMINMNLTWASIESEPGVYREPWYMEYHQHNAYDEIHVALYISLSDPLPEDLEGLSPGHPGFIRRFNDMMDHTLDMAEDVVIVDCLSIDAGEATGKALQTFIDEVKHHIEEVDPSVMVIDRIRPLYEARTEPVYSVA